MKTSNSLYDWSWFRRGVASFATLPAVILVSAYVGFGALARDTGISLAHLIFMIPTVWALPSHLLLISGIAANTSILAIAIAVALASLRMMPMTMALVPEVRVSGSRKWHLLAASNLVAITAWVNLMQHAPDIPRPGRLPYFVGFGLSMVAATMVAASTVHILAGAMPHLLMAALTFLTPLYFATSMWNAARYVAERWAFAAGFCLLPLAMWVAPQAAVLIAGAGGGLLAFAASQLRKARGVR